MQTRSRLLACSALMGAALSLSLWFDLDQAQSQASLNLPISQDLLRTYDLPNAAGQYGQSILVDRSVHGRLVGGFVFAPHGLREGSFVITPDQSVTLFTCGPTVTWTQVRGVNRHGAAVGWCAIAEPNIVTGFYRAANGTITPLRYPGARHTEAHDINDGHSVVGLYSDQAGAMHGFRWDQRTNRYTRFDVPFPGVYAFIPHTITDGGVIGVLYFTQETWGVGILRQGQWTNIPLPGTPQRSLLDVTHLTDDGRLIGVLFDGTQGVQSFLWQDGVYTLLPYPAPHVEAVWTQVLTPGNILVGRVEWHRPIPEHAPEGTAPELVTQGFVASLTALLGSSDGPPPPAP